MDIWIKYLVFTILFIGLINDAEGEFFFFFPKFISNNIPNA